VSVSKARKAWWRGQREQASTPDYSIQEVDGDWWVMLSGERIAGPMTNAEAWRWIDRQTTARRYGQAEGAA
jgi:hypothetical protein